MAIDIRELIKRVKENMVTHNNLLGYAYNDTRGYKRGTVDYKGGVDYCLQTMYNETTLYSVAIALLTIAKNISVIAKELPEFGYAADKVIGFTSDLNEIEDIIFPKFEDIQDRYEEAWNLEKEVLAAYPEAVKRKKEEQEAQEALRKAQEEASKTDEAAQQLRLRSLSEDGEEQKVNYDSDGSNYFDAEANSK